MHFVLELRAALIALRFNSVAYPVGLCKIVPLAIVEPLIGGVLSFLLTFGIFQLLDSSLNLNTELKHAMRPLRQSTMTV